MKKAVKLMFFGGAIIGAATGFFCVPDAEAGSSLRNYHGKKIQVHSPNIRHRYSDSGQRTLTFYKRGVGYKKARSKYGNAVSIKRYAMPYVSKPLPGSTQERLLRPLEEHIKRKRWEKASQRMPSGNYAKAINPRKF